MAAAHSPLPYNSRATGSSNNTYSSSSATNNTMDSVVDINPSGFHSLEQTFHSLVVAVNKQAKQLQAIEQRIPAAGSLSKSGESITQLLQRLDHSMHDLTERMASIERRVTTMEDMATVVNEHADHIEQIQTQLTTDVPQRKDLEELNQTLLQTINHTFDNIHREKASKSLVDALSQSNKAVTEQMQTVQSLLNHKIDRSELPLLESTNERLQQFLDFEQETGERLHRLEAELQQQVRAIQGKESKEAIVARMQAIHQHLQRKADVKQVSELDATLQRLQQQHGVIESLAEQHQQMEQQLQTMSEGQQHHQTLQEYLETLRSKVDAKLDANQLSQVKSDLQKQFTTTINQSTADVRKQQAYIAELKAQIVELQGANVAVEQKLSVALKFVDWFTESRL